MRKISTFITLLSAFLCAAFAAGADVLVLADGASISGQVVRVSEGVLVFRTKLKGQMMAPMDTVHELKTDMPLMLTLKNPDADAYGKLSSVGEKPHLLPLAGGDPVPLDLARIVEASPIPTSAEPESDASKLPKLNVETGVMSRSGKDNGVAPFAHIGLNADTPKVEFRMDNLLEGIGSYDFPKYFKSQSTLSGKGESPWQPAAQIGFERDTGNALDLRTDLTLGVNYNFRTQADTSFGAILGINYVNEDWDSGRREWGSSDKDHGQDLNLKLGLRYTKALTAGTEFDGDLAVLPGLSNLGDFRATSSASLQKNLGDHLHLRLGLNLDYNNDPAFAGIDAWTAGVGAGIGLHF